MQQLIVRTPGGGSSELRLEHLQEWTPAGGTEKFVVNHAMLEVVQCGSVDIHLQKWKQFSAETDLLV